jgi:uncharacterized protein with HEPN domain
MHSEDRDAAYMWDMREEARNIGSFIKDISYARFVQDKVIRYAVERSLLIIGEAANHVSDKYKETHSEIPWQQIIGQRNVLAHEYGDIKVDRIWFSVTVSVPSLLKALDGLIPDDF